MIPMTDEEIQAMGFPGHKNIKVELVLNKGYDYGAGFRQFTIRDINKNIFYLKSWSSGNLNRQVLVLTTDTAEATRAYGASIPITPGGYQLKNNEIEVDISCNNTYNNGWYYRLGYTFCIGCFGTVSNDYYFMGNGGTSNITILIKNHYWLYEKLEFNSYAYGSGRSCSGVAYKVYYDDELKFEGSERWAYNQGGLKVYAFDFSDFALTSDESRERRELGEEERGDS